MITLAPPNESNKYINWSYLNKPEYPILFSSIEGQEQREDEIPSFFNTNEASQISTLIYSLINEQNATENEIGVLTPFSKQAQKIKFLLEKRGFASIKVGTLEDFLYTQKKVLLISTVRTSRK